MPPQELLLVVFCLIDDEMKAAGGPPRRPGPRPRLADSEVITIELVGEHWRLADDAAIFRHFRAHHLGEFPALARMERTRFVRHAADLCWLKRRIQQRLVRRLASPGCAWLIDSCPLPACRFGRAGYCRRFRGRAAYGFDPLAREAFYGFRLHLRTGMGGLVLGYELAPADAHELDLARELAPRPPGPAIGDRNYWSPTLRQEFRAAGGDLIAPFKQGKRDPDPEGSESLLGLRRRIEAVFSHLVDWFDCRRVKVRDLWHLEHRLVRKILALTVAAWLNVRLEIAFREIKEVVGAGKQQVRFIHASVDAFHVCLWTYTMTEAWAWNRSEAELVDRSESPWDAPARRPSRADKRRAWRREILLGEILALLCADPTAAEIQAAADRLLRLTA